MERKISQQAPKDIEIFDDSQNFGLNCKCSICGEPIYAEPIIRNWFTIKDKTNDKTHRTYEIRFHLICFNIFQDMGTPIMRYNIRHGDKIGSLDLAIPRELIKSTNIIPTAKRYYLNDESEIVSEFGKVPFEKIP